MRSDREKRRNGSGDSVDTLSSIDSNSRLRQDDRDKQDRRHRRGRDEQYTSDRRHRRERQHSHDDDHDRGERRQERQERRARREKRERRERRERREQRGRDRDEKLENPFESPPPYDDEKHRKPKDRPSPKRTASQDQGEEEQGTQPTTDRLLSKLERIGGPFIYIIPLLTAFCLLAASTCSADWWRKDVNIIRLGLPGDVYARLLATGNNLGKGGGEAVVDSGGKVQARAAKISPAGWLSVGFWGWCVGPEGDGPYVTLAQWGICMSWNG
jgi:hypothetical protein